MSVFLGTFYIPLHFQIPRLYFVTPEERRERTGTPDAPLLSWLLFSLPRSSAPFLALWRVLDMIHILWWSAEVE